MATRMILKNGDPQLRKHCHEVKDFNPRLHMLLDDMRQTLAESNGVGLAAPQVGVLRRAVIVLETNVPDGEEEYMIELINPTIVETAGEQTGAEGCLSIPNEFGIVQRPDYVKVRAQDRHGEWFEVEGRGLTARAFCHEIDHLDGVLFIDKAIRMLSPEELEQQAKGWGACASCLWARRILRPCPCSACSTSGLTWSAYSRSRTSRKTAA